MALITGAMWDIETALTVHYPSPDMLFATGQAYGWAAVAPGNVWADTAGTTPGVLDQKILRLDDERGAPWISTGVGPTYKAADGIYWLDFTDTDGSIRLEITVPAITNGTLMVAYKNAGVLSGNVTIPAGTYSIGQWGLFGIVGALLIDRNLSQAERDQVRQWFITERGAGMFSSMTLFGRFGRGQRLTSVDLFNTSAGTSFQEFLFGNNLTAIPMFNTSSGTSFHNFLSSNPLTTVPAGLFDNVKGTNFTSAFLDCALTQQSVDNILVSIATAAAANNLNNGTLTGLNSGTNAAPSATGVTAKNALIARGWTVTTN